MGYIVPFGGLVARGGRTSLVPARCCSNRDHVPGVGAAERRHLPGGEGDRAEGDDLQPQLPAGGFSRFCQVQRVVDNTILALADTLPPAGDRGQLGRHPLLARTPGFVPELGRVLAVPRGQRGLLRRPVRQGRHGLRRQPHGQHAQQPDRGARPALPGALRPVRAAPGAGGAGQVARRDRDRPRATASSSTATYSCEGYRQYDPPRGIFGGWNGLAASTHKNPGTAAEEYLEAKVTGIEFKAGEYIEFREPSGGGYGDPLERDPAMVREDVLDDFTTIELARDAYGVVFVDERDFEVDAEATERRRAEVLAARNGGPSGSLDELFHRGSGKLRPTIRRRRWRGTSSSGWREDGRSRRPRPSRGALRVRARHRRQRRRLRGGPAGGDGRPRRDPPLGRLGDAPRRAHHPLRPRDAAQLPVDVTARSTVVEMGSLRDDVHVELEATATLVDAA